MGSLIRPTGSEPVTVYWRRRALVIGVALVVVIGLVVVLWPKGSPSAAPVPLATVPTVAALPTPTPVPSPGGSPASALPATPTSPLACDPLSIRVGLAGFKKLKAGSAQAFKVSLTNSTSVPCVLTPSSDNLTVTVTSGKDRIWSTADCAESIPAKKLTLGPQQAYVFGLNWPGVRSSSGCKITKATVGAGTYLAKATFTGAEPARLVMQITA
jgi:hypothetical protein